MKYDLHMHSEYSKDSHAKVKDIVKTAIKKGLDGIAITDHNTIEGGLKAKKYETKKFRVIVGSEILTNRGDIIGLFLKNEVIPGNLSDVVKDIRKQGGIVVAPHPFDNLRKGIKPTQNDVKLMDAIEIFNARCLFEKYNNKAKEFAEKYHVPITAGSDAHFIEEIGRAGIVVKTHSVKSHILKKQTQIFAEHVSFFQRLCIRAKHKIY